MIEEQYDDYSADQDDDFSQGHKGSRNSKRSQERRKWEPHEDAQLLRLIRKWGTKNWRTLANHMKGRLPKQCRERWINHLDPAITKGKLSDEEWQIVLACHRDLGNRWSEIAKFLPGRTPNQIKNHWHAKVRKGTKRTREDGSLSDDGSSDSRDDGFDEVPMKKRPRMVVFESPPESPTPRTTPNSPLFQNTGTWEDFRTLVETAELMYRAENPHKGPVVQATIVEADAYSYPSPSSSPSPARYEQFSQEMLPAKHSLPEYSFGLQPISIPLAPNLSTYWRTM